MKAFCWAFILFQSFWLIVVLPGHTRGAVRVPGTTPPACATSSREAEPRPCCAKENNGKPTADDIRCCAVCWFALGMDVVEPVCFDLELRRSAERSAVPTFDSVDHSPPAYTFLATGPPAA